MDSRHSMSSWAGMTAAWVSIHGAGTDRSLSLVVRSPWPVPIGVYGPGAMPPPCGSSAEWLLYTPASWSFTAASCLLLCYMHRVRWR